MFDSSVRIPFQCSSYLRVQVFPFDTQVGINDVQAHQQAHNHCSLFLQHQRWILIEITAEEDTRIYNYQVNRSYFDIVTKEDY